MPISFSACCNISLVTRNGAGEGDGEGDGNGVAVGEGVCANEPNCKCGATTTAVPSAGTSFTKERLSIVSVFDAPRFFFTRFSSFDRCFMDFNFEKTLKFRVHPFRLLIAKRKLNACTLNFLSLDKISYCSIGCGLLVLVAGLLVGLATVLPYFIFNNFAPPTR